MKQKVLASILIILFFSGSAYAATVYVPDNYPSIQEAVNNASPADTVIVRDGTYHENVLIDRQLTVRSENGPALCIVDAGGSGSVFKLNADGITLEGFTATHSGYGKPHAGIEVASNNNTIIHNVTPDNYYGIYIHQSSTGNSLTGNTANNNYYGIYLDRADNHTLTGNTTNSNYYYGIHLARYSCNNTLTGNTTNANTHHGIFIHFQANDNILSNNIANDNNQYGIYLSGTSNNTLTNNSMDNNKYNFSVSPYGFWIPTFIHSIETSNTVGGKPVYYLVGESDRAIDSSTNAGYVGLVNCNNITVRDLTLTRNGEGVLLVNTTNSSVINTTAIDNFYGIDLFCSENITLQGTHAHSNIYNFWISGDSSSHYVHAIDTSNTVAGGPIHYLIGESYRTIDPSTNAGYVGLVNCHHIIVKDLILTNNSDAVLLVNTTDSSVLNVNATYNVYGIRLLYSERNLLENNNTNNNHNGIYLSHSDHNTLKGNAVSENDHGLNDRGIWMGYSDNNRLMDNIFSKNRYGTILVGCSDNMIENNESTDDTFGIYLDSCGATFLHHNRISGRLYGISIIGTSNASLTGNSIQTCNWNFGVSGNTEAHYTHDIDTSNTVDGRPIYYLVGESNRVIDASTHAGYVGLVGCSNITIRDLSLDKNRQGILLAYTTNSSASNLTISKNEYGVSLYSSNHNTLEGCKITETQRDGISLASSEDNLIYNNYVENNRNVSDDGTNTWNIPKTPGTNIVDGPYLGGNYWSNYTGIDSDGDGLGDTPYIINAQGQDNHPLVYVASMAVSPTSYDFGTLLVGSSKTGEIIISNSGHVDCIITDISIDITFQPGADAEFAIAIQQNLPTTLAPEETLTIPITFSPESPGPKSALLEIASNDPDSPISVNLRGMALAPSSVFFSPGLLGPEIAMALPGEEEIITLPIVPAYGDRKHKDIQRWAIVELPEEHHFLVLVPVQWDPSESDLPNVLLGRDSAWTISLLVIPLKWDPASDSPLSPLSMITYSWEPNPEGGGILELEDQGDRIAIIPEWDAKELMLTIESLQGTMAAELELKYNAIENNLFWEGTEQSLSFTWGQKVEFSQVTPLTSTIPEGPIYVNFRDLASQEATMSFSYYAPEGDGAISYGLFPNGLLEPSFDFSVFPITMDWEQQQGYVLFCIPVYRDPCDELFVPNVLINEQTDWAFSLLLITVHMDFSDILSYGQARPENVILPIVPYEMKEEEEEEELVQAIFYLDQDHSVSLTYEGSNAERFFFKMTSETALSTCPLFCANEEIPALPSFSFMPPAELWYSLPPFNLLAPVNMPLITELTSHTALSVQPTIVWDPVSSPDVPWLLYNVPPAFGGGSAYFDEIYGFKAFPPEYLLDPETGDPLPIALPFGYKYQWLPDLDPWLAKYQPIADQAYVEIYGCYPVSITSVEPSHLSPGQSFVITGKGFQEGFKAALQYGGYGQYGVYTLGSWETSGSIEAVAINGEYTFIATRTEGLQIIDISDPKNINIIGACNTLGKIGGLFVSGSYTYVAGESAGLQVIDISDPTDPHIVGTCDVPDVPGKVKINEPYAYVTASGAGLIIVDVTDAANPYMVCTCSTPGSAEGLCITPSTAYVADGPEGLQVVDIFDPTGPHIVGSCDTPGYANDVKLSWPYAYVADGEEGLQVIDISDPANPSIVSTFNTPGYAYEVDKGETYEYIYVADGPAGLQVIDTTDPYTPTLVYPQDNPDPSADIDIIDVYEDADDTVFIYLVGHGDNSRLWSMQMPILIPASFETPNTIKGIIRELRPGTYDIQVTNPDGGYAVYHEALIVQSDKPVVEHVTQWGSECDDMFIDLAVDHTMKCFYSLGTTYCAESNQSDIMVIKSTFKGNIGWKQKLDKGGNEHASFISLNRWLYIGGYTEGGGNSFMLISVDPLSGKEISTNYITLPVEGTAIPKDVAMSSIPFFMIVVGDTDLCDGFATMFDTSDGRLLSSFGDDGFVSFGTSEKVGIEACHCDNNSCVIVGSSTTETGDTAAYIVRLNLPDGQIDFEQTFGGIPEADYIFTSVCDHNDSYWCTGSINNNGTYDPILVKYTYDGIQENFWQFSFDGNNRARDISVSGEDLIICGDTDHRFEHYSGGGGLDGFIFQFNPGSGAVPCWSFSFGTEADESGIKAEVSNNYIVVPGSTFGAFTKFGQHSAGDIDMFVGMIIDPENGEYAVLKDAFTVTGEINHIEATVAASGKVEEPLPAPWHTGSAAGLGGLSFFTGPTFMQAPASGLWPLSLPEPYPFYTGAWGGFRPDTFGLFCLMNDAPFPFFPMPLGALGLKGEFQGPFPIPLIFMNSAL